MSKWILLLGILFSTNLYAKLPVLKLPDEYNVSWISEQMFLDGHNMSIQSLETNLSLPFALEEIKSELDKDWNDVKKTKIDGWTYLVSAKEGHVISVRLKQEDASTTGFIVISSTTHKKFKLYFPGGFELVQHQRYEEVRENVDMFTLVTSSNQITAVNTLISHYQRLGWTFEHAGSGQYFLSRDKNDVIRVTPRPYKSGSMILVVRIDR